MRKVVIFGALGAAGCLLSWALGEGFLKLGIPWANAVQGVAAPSILTPPEPSQLSSAEKPAIAEQLAVATPAPPPTPEPFRAAKAQEPPPPSADFAQRLQREGAHEGDVEIALIWWNVSDLDLHVVDPAGTEIYFGNKKAPSGGELDVDMNVNYPLSGEPVEHVYFPKGGAPGGHYKVSVTCFTDRAQRPIEYKVEVKANGERRQFEGSITNKGRAQKATNFVTEFDVHVSAPELRLSVPENISIAPEGSNDFRVRIARGSFDEAVALRLDWGGGLSIDAAQIPKGETVGTVTIHASSAVTPGQKTTHLTASAETPRGHVETAAELHLTILQPRKAESVLKLAVPSTVQVLQNDSNRFKARVGRYFFPSPPPVKLKLALDNSDLRSSEAVVEAGSDEALIQIHAARNATPGKRKVALVAKTISPAVEVRENLVLEVVGLPPPKFGWPMVLVVAIWTGLLAIGLSFLLVIGQNHYLGRPLLDSQQARFVLIGGLAAGGIAGGVGQTLLAHMQSIGGGAVPPEIGQIAGWCLLGLLLGYGMAFYIPNLSGPRAALAGAIGGLIGVGGFLALTHFVGETAGRFAGAGILGFAIGSMVALVEAVFREAWLEVRYGPKEVRTVSLGREPVSLGSNQNACTVYAANAAPIAYRYWLKDNTILCEDVPNKRVSNVGSGDRKQVGNLVATVCAAGAVAQAPQTVPARKTSGFSLRLSNGRSIALANGVKLSNADLPGLHSIPPGGPVATVSSHPTDPSILGLQNLSHLSWSVRLANGDGVEVKTGKNVRLAAGTRINFGSIEGTIEM